MFSDEVTSREMSSSPVGESGAVLDGDVEGMQGLGSSRADDLEPAGAFLQVVRDAAVAAPAESDAGPPCGVAVAAADDRFPVQVDGGEGAGGGSEMGEDNCCCAA